MPRYLYQCGTCHVTSSVFHLISETVTDCDACHSTKCMNKIIGTPFVINKKINKDKTNIGDITNEYIETNREILNQEKSKRESYD